MKVALVHDHLAQDGGAEKVLKVLADIFPEAKIFTLLYEKNNADKYYKGREIDTSIIQRLPGGVKHYQWYMPFMPMAVEFFDLTSFDLVISDTSSFAKGVITLPETPHICYCHTPTRYLWSDTHSYINELRYNKYFKKVISLVLNKVRIWDRLAADRVDYFIANSYTVQKRIKKYYRRNSEVIYPPVETNDFKINKSKDKEFGKPYFLVGGRLAPYKRNDLVIEVFKELNWKLKVFGDGVDMKRLKKIADGNPNIEFLGWVERDHLNKLYSNAEALIHPQVEDFGISLIEAMASGRPVVALKEGGATETVLEGKTGLFFKDQKAESLKACLENFYSYKFDSQFIRNHSKNFSREKFEKNLRKFILDKTNLSI
ncbi:glycosyltransferase [bacterium]|nr:glycosyltransferase [bacterium]